MWQEITGFGAQSLLELIIPSLLWHTSKPETLTLISPSGELFSDLVLFDLELSMLEPPLLSPPQLLQKEFFPFMSSTCRFILETQLFRLLRRRTSFFQRGYAVPQGQMFSLSQSVDVLSSCSTMQPPKPL